MRRTAGYTAAALLLAGCISPHGAAVVDTDPAAWRTTATVELRNGDTTGRRELRIVVRHNLDFGSDTLTVALAVTSPDSLVFRDTLRLRLPERTTASALGTDASIPYREGVVLSHEGDYKFDFTPLRSVRGIEAIGVEMIQKEPNGKR